MKSDVLCVLLFLPFFRHALCKPVRWISGKKQLFLVRTFDNAELAMRYYKAARNNKQLMLEARKQGAEEYLISAENFRMLFRSKTENQYKEFFEENYPE